MKPMIKLISLMVLLGFLSACAGMTPQQQASADALYKIALRRVITANPKYKEPVLNVLNAGKAALATNSIMTQDGVAQWISAQVAKRFKNPDGTIDPDIQDLTYLLLSSYLPQWQGSTLKVLNADDRKMLSDLIDMSIMVVTGVQTS